MLSHGKQDKSRHRHIPKFHKNTLWQHVDLDDHDQLHNHFCFREPEQCLSQETPFSRPNSYSENNSYHLRRISISDPLEASRLDASFGQKHTILLTRPYARTLNIKSLCCQVPIPTMVAQSDRAVSFKVPRRPPSMFRS